MKFSERKDQRGGAVQVVFNTKPPFQKPQLIQVQATWPIKGLGNPKREAFIASGNFMEIVCQAQRKFQGAKISASVIRGEVD